MAVMEAMVVTVAAMAASVTLREGEDGAVVVSTARTDQRCRGCRSGQRNHSQGGVTEVSSMHRQPWHVVFPTLARRCHEMSLAVLTACRCQDVLSCDRACWQSKARSPPAPSDSSRSLTASHCISTIFTHINLRLCDGRAAGLSFSGVGTKRGHSRRGRGVFRGEPCDPDAGASHIAAPTFIASRGGETCDAPGAKQSEQQNS